MPISVFYVTLSCEILPRGWRQWVLIFIGATAFGLFLASQSYLLYKSYNSKSIPIIPLVVLALIQTWAWFLLLPGILASIHYFPLERPVLARNLTTHIAGGALFALVNIALRVWINSYLPWSGAAATSFGERFQNLFLSSFQTNLMVYWAIVGGYQGLAYYRKVEERELRASQLEARLAQAQLQALRIQLQPHFLFNTLHAISALIQKDPDAADHTVALLSDLLRLTLETGSDQEVPLQQELDDFVQLYIEIEKTRFGDRLTVELDIANNVRAARVPSFLLQPLVENAIRHGIAPRAEGGRVEITARRNDGDLTVTVRDNGRGLAGTAIHEGLGLGNTRARLQQFYGDGQWLLLTEAPGGGAVVRLTIPFRNSAGTPIHGAEE